MFIQNNGYEIVECSYLVNGLQRNKCEHFIIRTSLRFKKWLNFSINLRKLSIFYRACSNQSEALFIILKSKLETSNEYKIVVLLNLGLIQKGLPLHMPNPPPIMKIQLFLQLTLSVHPNFSIHCPQRKHSSSPKPTWQQFSFEVDSIRDATFTVSPTRQ